MRSAVTGVGAVLLLLVVAGCQSVPPEVLQKLPENQARELAVYSRNHAVIFDLRIHSMDTCPFLTYMPNALSMNHDSNEWAVWLLHFNRAKHQEEKHLYHCTCEKQLSEPPKPAPNKST